MSISLEKIDLLMERANVSYKEAKETLERTEGDLLEALIILENNQKTRGPEKSKSCKNKEQADEFKKKANSFFKDLQETRFTIKNSEKKALDVSLLTASVITLVTMPVSIFVLAIPYLFGHKIEIEKSKSKSDSTPEE
ncbi:MAG: ubiquitin-associated-domain-containing protein [uncultured bacterium (gcode 4)]|uniref:Ubiquitin-associated-domain-containing protein n=1 Tax=uncultured bacterium (gcode 4) TaxID=1234023 RepID=K2F865_9BACT|nr:MAG: ubiquitin-associated-domain-containing protein [uncultured bacterium (gcode 4)]